MLCCLFGQHRKVSALDIFATVIADFWRLYHLKRHQLFLGHLVLLTVDEVGSPH